MKNIIIVIVCLRLISCIALINDKELRHAEHHTQAAYVKMISALKNPNASEKEITMCYLNYSDNIREEAKIRGKIGEWNEAISNYTISHQGSMETQTIRKDILNQMQFLNKHSCPFGAPRSMKILFSNQRIDSLR